MLVAIGIAKIASGLGTSDMLKEMDPLLGVPNRSLITLVGCGEVALGAYCLFGSDGRRKGILLTWLGLAFLSYRIGLWWIGYKKPCTCLGNVADKIGLSDLAADNIMKAVLSFLILAGLIALFQRPANPRATHGA